MREKRTLSNYETLRSGNMEPHTHTHKHTVANLLLLPAHLRVHTHTQTERYSISAVQGSVLAPGLGIK